MRSFRAFAALAALTVLITFAGSVGAVFQPPAKVEKKQVPPHRGLDSALYVQTSAEYKAACLQAYRYATLLLNTAVRDNCGGKLAVVLDLDETVLDNSELFGNWILKPIPKTPLK